MDESIKSAFSKVKEDITNLGFEISSIKLDILDIKQDISSLKKEFDRFLTQKLEKEAEIPLILPVETPSTLRQITPTIQHITPTHPETSTDDYALKPLESQNIPISIGNRGVPTDRQTDQQTDRHIIQHINVEPNTSELDLLPTTATKENNLDKASEILESLDNIKKELRIKIKRLTPQEMHIFSMIYQLSNSQISVDYKLLADKTHLSQSSMRDYIQRIISKGLPIQKTKQNNKNIILSISEDLKKIASLETVLRLREL